MLASLPPGDESKSIWLNEKLSPTWYLTLSPNSSSCETMSRVGFDGLYASISPFARACTHSCALITLKTNADAIPGVPHHLSFLTNVNVPLDTLSYLYGPEAGISVTSGIDGSSGW